MLKNEGISIVAYNYAHEIKNGEAVEAYSHPLLYHLKPFWIQIFKLTHLEYKALFLKSLGLFII